MERPPSKKDEVELPVHLQFIGVRINEETVAQSRLLTLRLFLRLGVGAL
jgi:hypothetical protein